MTISVFDAAKRLCQESNWAISNLELQKLLYIAHMLHLGEHGEPLIHEYFEAWNYGPVQPSLYHHAKVFGSSPVKNIFHSAEDIPPSTESTLLDQVVAQFSHRTAAWLVAVTHWQKGAWANNYKSGAKGIIIPNADNSKIA